MPNLAPRVFLRHTLIIKPSKHPGAIFAQIYQKVDNLAAIMDLQLAR